VDRHAPTHEAADRVALAQHGEREGEQGLDLGRAGPQVELARVRDAADEGVDAVAGDEGVGRRQRLAELDRGRVEADLLLGLAQRRRGEVGVCVVLAAAGEGDLAGVAAQVGAPLGEDQPWVVVRPAVEGEENRCVNGGGRLTCPPGVGK